MSRKESLIHASIEIINRVGYQNFSTRELAKSQNISDAAIYKHFKSKAEIVIGILDIYKDFFNQIKMVIETEQLSTIDALDYYIQKFLDFYTSHPDMVMVLNSVESLSHEKEISDVITEIVFLRLSFLTNLLQKGIDNREFIGVISAENMALMMLGSMTAVIQIWKLNGYGFSLTEKINTITNQIKQLILCDKNELS